MKEYASLLKDMNTNKNIVWATGEDKEKEITEKDLQVIKPRHLKEDVIKKARSKSKGEVYTPTWVCKKMIDEIDAEWSGSEIEYIKRKTLEITCGEGAFLVSRYNSTNGKKIGLKNRIGILDRKLKIARRIARDKREWKELAIEAYKSTYGYEYQGDSLYIARRNLLLTYIENYIDLFREYPENIKTIIDIITWNIWQMDGLTGEVPYSKSNLGQISIFGKVKNNKVLAKIKNWDNGEIIIFNDINKK